MTNHKLNVRNKLHKEWEKMAFRWSTLTVISWRPQTSKLWEIRTYIFTYKCALRIKSAFGVCGYSTLPVWPRFRTRCSVYRMALASLAVNTSFWKQILWNYYCFFAFSRSEKGFMLVIYKTVKYLNQILQSENSCDELLYLLINQHFYESCVQIKSPFD